MFALYADNLWVHEIILLYCESLVDTNDSK